MKLSTTLIASMGLMAAVGLGVAQAATPADSSSSSTGSVSQPGMASQPNAPMQSSNSGATDKSSASTGMNAAQNGSANVAPKDVMALQQALQQQGENIKPDGVWGPSTQAALKHYQQQSGLPATGQLDQATRAKLNLPG